jgi:hypothetical protein
MFEEKRILINNEPTKYLVDSNGNVYSEYSEMYLKPFENPSGYLLVDLHHKGKSYYRQVHRLVAHAFIPNPEGLPTVNHKNGDKHDNHYWNLEWMTIKDNVRHAWSTGLVKPRYGIDNPANVYSEDQIHAVCSLLESRKYSNKKIAEMYNVNVTLIRDIKFRGKWKHISCQYDIDHQPSGHRHLKPFIWPLILKGYSNQEIVNKLGLSHAEKRYVERLKYVYNHSLND